MKTIKFTKDADGNIFGYDSDSASQKLAVSNIADGHVDFDFAAPDTSQILAKAQQSQAATISSACAAAIISGFKSSALGKPYTYPSNETDQLNLSGNVMSSLFPELSGDWSTLQACCDEDGAWAYLPHTVAQIQQVGIDFKTFKLDCLTRNAALQKQVSEATTVDAVQEINF